MGYAHSQIEVRYNSNCIELPDRLLEQWKHFQKVLCIIVLIALVL